MNVLKMMLRLSYRVKICLKALILQKNRSILLHHFAEDCNMLSQKTWHILNKVPTLLRIIAAIVVVVIPGRRRRFRVVFMLIGAATVLATTLKRGKRPFRKIPVVSLMNFCY